MLVIPGFTGFGVLALICAAATYIYWRAAFRSGEFSGRFASSKRRMARDGPGIAAFLVASGLVLVVLGMLLRELPRTE